MIIICGTQPGKRVAGSRRGHDRGVPGHCTTIFHSINKYYFSLELLPLQIIIILQINKYSYNLQIEKRVAYGGHDREVPRHCTRCFLNRIIYYFSLELFLKRVIIISPINNYSSNRNITFPWNYFLKNRFVIPEINNCYTIEKCRAIVPDFSIEILFFPRIIP